jgi:hypothetical protein
MKVDLNNKPSNPKDMLAVAKMPYHLWPNTATVLGVMAMLEGACKYGRSNYRAVGVRASVYYDSLRRHADAWFEGENLTKDHRLHHLGNALACLAIIVDAECKDFLIDDRMYPGGYIDLLERLTPEIARIKAMYKDRKPHHYSLLDITQHGRQNKKRKVRVSKVRKQTKHGRK